MEFLIFSSTNRYVPQEISNILAKEPFPYNRTGEVVDYLKFNCFEIDIKKMGTNAVKKALLENPNKFAHFWDKPNLRELYFFLSENEKEVLVLNVVDVDILYRWRIAEYQGREFVIMEEKDPMVIRDINYYDIFRKREFLGEEW